MKSKNLLLPKNLSLAEYLANEQYSLKEFIRQIDLNKPKLKKIETLLFGLFQSTKTGSGFDFNEIREYKIGDDLRHISWSTTAKTGTLHTKEFLAEKEVRSYFLVDISNSMLCGKKLHILVQTFAFLLNLSCSFSEKIAGIYFSEDIKYYFPFSAAYTQSNVMFQTFINYLDKARIKGISSTNLNKALEFTKRSFYKKGVIYLISDFINLSNWEKLIYATSQNQNIYSFQIYDQIDYNLPKSGYVSIIDPETNERFIVNTDSTKVQETYNVQMIKSQEKLTSFLKSIGVHHFLMESKDF